jgi:hypothetical protein
MSWSTSSSRAIHESGLRLKNKEQEAATAGQWSSDEDDPLNTRGTQLDDDDPNDDNDDLNDDSDSEDDKNLESDFDEILAQIKSSTPLSRLEIKCYGRTYQTKSSIRTIDYDKTNDKTLENDQTKNSHLGSDVVRNDVKMGDMEQSSTRRSHGIEGSRTESWIAESCILNGDKAESDKPQSGILESGKTLCEDKTCRICFYKASASKLSDKCSWLLTLLAKKIPKDLASFSKFKIFLNILLHVCPRLLCWKEDAHGETVLHIGIQEGHKLLIKHLYDNSELDIRSEALREPSSNGINCLYAAVQHRSPDVNLVKQILKWMNDDGNSTAINKSGPGGNTPLHLAVDAKRYPCRINGSAKEQAKVVKRNSNMKKIVEALLEASVMLIRMPNDDKLTPLQFHYKTRKSLGVQADANETMVEIEELLKLSCLRLDLDREETWKILYGDQIQPREIFFDLFGYNEIRADDLEYLAGHLSFETVLKSVAIPTLSIQPTEKYLAAKKESPPTKPEETTDKTTEETTDETLVEKPIEEEEEEEEDQNESTTPIKEKDDILPDCPGRIDYCWVFKWLKLQGVKKILRLSVEDHRDMPHSDESIEWCLKTFGVEIWDWKKLDICCTTIATAAPEVRDLTLYCSGNNAVLRSWISPGGIAELQQVSP